MKTAILLGTLTGLLLVAGGFFGMYIGGNPIPYLTFAFIIAMLINFVGKRTKKNIPIFIG